MDVRLIPCLVAALVATSPARGDDRVAIDDMDVLRFHAPKEKGRAELVAGKVGKAVYFRFEKDARSTFFTSNIHGTPEWDRADGFSFWVKGDGADGFGGLQFIYDDDYSVRYDFAFPVKGKEWTKVVVRWQDLVPVLPGPRAKPLRVEPSGSLATPTGIRGGNSPSKLTGLWIGKWWYWGDYPALSFTVDEFRLEPYLGIRVFAPHEPDRALAKLKAGKPITIVTMGDSLTDVRHWANREVAWPTLLKGRLEAQFGSKVTIVNPAIGGTQLRQNLVLIPVWLETAPEPDLVTIFFGGNDLDAGMRAEDFATACADAVGRVRIATHDKADVVLITTNPSASRWEATAGLADACRKAAVLVRAGLADTEKAFQIAGKADREHLFVRDRVHLSRAGHEVVAETVARAIRRAD